MNVSTGLDFPQGSNVVIMAFVATVNGILFQAQAAISPAILEADALNAELVIDADF